MIIKRAKNPWHRVKRGTRANLHALRDRLGIPPGRKAASDYARPNILHINMTGLGTDPHGEANGMRDQAETFLTLYPESDYAFFSHAELDANPPAFCARLVKLVDDGNVRGRYTHVIFRGHSLGGAALMFFLNWLANKSRSVAFVVLFDPVPNLILGQFGRWKRPASAPAESLCITQRNGASELLVFPTGTPVDGMTCVDVTDWDFPRLYHSSMIADPRVWDITLRAMRKAVSH